MRSSVVFKSVVHSQLKSILKHPLVRSNSKRKKMIQNRSGTSRMVGSEDDYKESLAVPESDEQLMAGVLDKLQCCELDFKSPWETRRAILSKSFFSLTFAESTGLADCIPLHEISHVVELNSKNRVRSFRPEGHEEWSRQSIWEQEDCSRNWFVLAIYTIDGGVNAGRTYFLRAESDSSRNDWIQAIRKRAKTVLKEREHQRMENSTWLERTKSYMHRVHGAPSTQNALALLIAVNFSVSCLEAQLVPSSSTDIEVFFSLDIMFTIAFVIELCINMFVHWFRRVYL
jgi:hypothetical protein